MNKVLSKGLDNKKQQNVFEKIDNCSKDKHVSY